MFHTQAVGYILWTCEKGILKEKNEINQKKLEIHCTKELLKQILILRMTLDAVVQNSKPGTLPFGIVPNV